MTADDDLEDLPVERRAGDRRQRDVPVAVDRRQGERRANKLAPKQAFAGVAIVVDPWPLMRAGVRQLLEASAMRVAADDAAAAVACRSVGDRLDLAIIGATTEPLPEVVDQVRRLPGPEAGQTPRVLIMLERVEADLLRRLLAMGVEGIVQRSIGLDDLRAAAERILAGQRVLSGGPLSVLASAGLEVAEPAVERTDDGGLTAKELEVLSQLAQHQSNREIAERLHVSAATVKTHLSNIYSKMGVADRRQAVVAAVERGLLT
ncbi:LuxR C-terminal-related transcriptional regulator [Euzebya sp.]|uniref:LuxR C-terminal-related transcriptional regulator n=1 Tax=Euzebya sp. TaxID=1971409 RepID=UPI003513A93A